MNIKSILSKVGFSTKEIDVYLISLGLGPKPASIIAEKACMNRVTTYVTLQKLVSKGVISTFKQQGMQYFSAEEPRKLLLYIKRKQSEFQKLGENLSEGIKRLEISQSDQSPPLNAEVMVGLEACKGLLGDLFETKQCIVFSAMIARNDDYSFYLREILLANMMKEGKQLTIYTPLPHFFESLRGFEQFKGQLEIIKTILPIGKVDYFIVNNEFVDFITIQNSTYSGARIHSPYLAHHLTISLGHSTNQGAYSK